jgi:hypothetical protein
LPTIKFVVDGQDHVVLADRVMRDSQQYVAERREDGAWLRVVAWRRGSVDAVLRFIDGPQPRWSPEDVRTSAGLDPQWSDATEDAVGAGATTRGEVGAGGWLGRVRQTSTATGVRGRGREVGGT